MSENGTYHWTCPKKSGDNNPAPNGRKLLRRIAFAAVVLVLFIMITTCFYTVDDKQQAVVTTFGKVTDVTDADWQKMLNTNLSGVFYACRSAAKVMVNQKNGSIVNVSSIWGITGASCEVAYSATKAGIIGLTKALAKELGPSNVRVNCVAPGVIDTEMNSNLDIGALADLADETPLGRIGTTEEVAKAIYYLANDADFITGQVLSPNGGIVV